MTEPPRPATPDHELIPRLQIDKHGLDDELVQQPGRVDAAGRDLAEAISMRDTLKLELKQVEAVVDQQVRLVPGPNDKKLPETAIAAQVDVHPEVLAKRRELIWAARRVGELEARVDAERTRGFALRDLVQLYIARYYAQDSVVAEEARRDAIRDPNIAARRARFAAQRSTT